MKNFLFILCTIFYAMPLCAQTVAVETGVEALGDGYNQAYRISIPHAKPGDLEKSWRSFIKKNDGKVKGSKKEIRGENVIIRGIGSDTLQFYSSIMEDKEGSVLKVAVEKGEVYVSSNSEPKLFKDLERIFRDFALQSAKQGLDAKINIAVEMIDQTRRNQEKINNENQRLGKENDRMKLQIENNEKTIEANKAKMETLLKQSEVQDSALKMLREKTGELK